MKIKKFIQKLENLEKLYRNFEVIMADNIPVKRVVFSDKYPKPNIIVTDQ